MDDDRARALLKDKRAEVQALLTDSDSATAEDQETAQETGDSADSAEPIAAEEVDSAVADSLRERLEAIERAEARIEAGTYGRSVRSGDPIPDERLEFDPTAELTVAEAESLE